MNTNDHTPLFALLGRLLWMGVGPGALFLTTMHIVINGTGWHTPVDYMFFALLISIVLGRWLEVLGGNPRTADGEPASEKDFYRYVSFVLGCGVALWVLANTFGNHGG